MNVYKILPAIALLLTSAYAAQGILKEPGTYESNRRGEEEVQFPKEGVTFERANPQAVKKGRKIFDDEEVTTPNSELEEEVKGLRSQAAKNAWENQKKALDKAENLHNEVMAEHEEFSREERRKQASARPQAPQPPSKAAAAERQAPPPLLPRD